MSARSWSVVVAGALGLGVLGAAADDLSQLQLGKQQYQANCAACHGKSGRGEGPRAETLNRIVPDLTTLSYRHGGVFPTAQAWLVVDGRSLPDAHQRARGMPVWGQEFRNEALANPTYRSPESFVGERVGALVDYVATLQADWTGPAPKE